MHNIIDEDSLTRDVYAHFGLALYLAQCLEYSLVNALCLGDFVRSIKGYAKANGLISRNEFEQRFDLYMDERFQETMGQLVAQLRGMRNLPSELSVEALVEAKALRNYLAHGYFRERAEAFMSIAGRFSMIEELKQAQKKFESLDEAFRPVVLAIAVAVGYDAQKLEAHTMRIMADIQSRAVARDDK